MVTPSLHLFFYYDTLCRIKEYKSTDRLSKFIYHDSGVSKLTFQNNRIYQQETTINYNGIELQLISMDAVDTSELLFENALLKFHKIIDSTNQETEVIRKITMFASKSGKLSRITVVKGLILEGRVVHEVMSGHRMDSISWHYNQGLLSKKIYFDRTRIKTRVEHFNKDGKVSLEEYFGGAFDQHEVMIEYTDNLKVKTVTTTRNREDFQVIYFKYNPSESLLLEVTLQNLRHPFHSVRKVYDYTFR
jgi:antitoxin component YwqK of YwqJK toxin-antitoxin module